MVSKVTIHTLHTGEIFVHVNRTFNNSILHLSLKESVNHDAYINIACSTVMWVKYFLPVYDMGITSNVQKSPLACIHCGVHKCNALVTHC